MANRQQVTGRRTQEERAQESSRRLLDAAVELIAEQGFEKTTVAEIGRRAGYSHSMVHARYGSKNALFEALIREHWQERLLSDFDTPLTGLERVTGQVDRFLRLLEEAPQEFRAILVLSFEMPAHAHTLKPWFLQWLERYYAHMVDNLDAGERDRTIRPGLDHRAEAERFVAFGTGLCFMWSLDWERYDIVGAFESWRDRLEVRYAAAR